MGALGHETRTFRRLGCYEIWVTAVLLVPLSVPQLLDAFGPERALMDLGWSDLLVGESMLGSLYAALGISLVLLFDSVLIPKLLGASRIQARTEFATTIGGLSLTHVVKGIEQRLLASRFLPEGPPPDAAAPRIVLKRPARILKLDSYEWPSLRMEIELEEHENSVRVRATLFRKRPPLSADTGEGAYDRALLEHIVTGMPQRRIADMGVLPMLTLYGAWFLSGILAIWSFGLISKEQFAPLAAMSIAFPAFCLLPGAFQVIRVPHISGTGLACAAALLLVCTAILVRSAL